MCLLIDIGNTRLKWAIKQPNGIHLGRAFFLKGREPLQRSFELAWKNLERPTRVIVANVAGAAISDQLSQWIRRRWALDVEFVSSCRQGHGVRIAYADPSKLGVDRWVCLLALRHFYLLPACVVDCGTAITLDVLEKTGNHRGGVIMPGLELMKASLLQGTSEIADSCGAGRVRLADNTGEAIESGGILAAAGMVEMVLRELEKEAGASFSLIVTGGDARRVAAQLVRPAILAPDLVLQGLAVMI
jgi:type III pantothenate kinase